MKIETDDVLCIMEISEMLGVHSSAVSNWQKRDVGFPEPLVEMRIGKLWLRDDIIAWANERQIKKVRNKETRIEFLKSQIEKLEKQK